MLYFVDTLSSNLIYTKLEVNRTFAVISVRSVETNIEKLPIVSLKVYVYNIHDVIVTSVTTNNTNYILLDGLRQYNEYKVCPTPIPLHGTGRYCTKRPYSIKTLPGDK